ncbi:tetratricopeptide repeat protein, partial [Thiolapillus sp.]
GLTYRKQGDADNEIADYSRLIDWPEAHVDEVARALLSRGANYGQQGDLDKAIADYSRLIELSEATVDEVALALLSRGVTCFQQEMPEKAVADFYQLLRLPKAPEGLRATASFALAEIFVGMGKWEEALSRLNDVLQYSGDDAGNAGENFADVVHALFESSLSPSVLYKRTRDIAQVCQNNDADMLLGKALISQLGKLYAVEKVLPASDSLALWASAWKEALEENRNMALPLRLLQTGIAFLESGGKDRNRLLDLNQEERRILEQAFGLEEK